MHFVYVPLYVGAFFVLMFTAILVIGSLIGLASFLMEVLRPAARAREEKVATTSAPPAVKPRAVEVETGTEIEIVVPAGAEYARC